MCFPLVDRLLCSLGDTFCLSVLSCFSEYLLAFGKHWWLMSKLPRWTFWIPVPTEALIARLALSLKRITLHLSAGAIELFAKSFSFHFIVTQNKCVFITHTHTHTHTHTGVRTHAPHRPVSFNPSWVTPLTTQACGARGWERMGWEAESEWCMVSAPTLRPAPSLLAPGSLLPIQTTALGHLRVWCWPLVWEELGLWIPSQF